jgi:thiol-disulfide isomerase/thioredoxin
MKKIFLIYILLIAVTFSAIAGKMGKKGNAPEQKTKAPNFSLTSTDGKVIKLLNYKDKIVIVDFWATWCPPCRAGIPDLIKIKNDYHGKVEVIGISVDAEGQSKQYVPDFIKYFNINYPVVYTTEKVESDFGGIEGYPTTFIIDQNGYIVEKYIGLTSKSTFTNVINKLLK